MEHLPTFLRAAKSRIFFSAVFFKSSTSQVFLFKACSTMPSSSWLVLNAVGLEGREEKKNKVGEILLISSCRFPFLYLAVALLCCLTYSGFTHFLSVDRVMSKPLLEQNKS